MSNNFLVIWFRYAWTNKIISAINIIGLSLGLMAITIILLWIENEFSYNSDIKDGDLISAVMVNQSFDNGEVQTYPATPPPLAKELKASIIGVAAAATTSWGDQVQFTVGKNKFTEYGLYVSPDFLKVFSVVFVSDKSPLLLTKPNTLVITESLARKYFGNIDAVGKTILVGNHQNYEVVGVIKDQNRNTTMWYNFLMPITDYFSFNPFMANDWSVNNVRTYVKFDPNTNRQKANSDIKTLLHNKSNSQQNSELFLFSLKDWYLKGEFKNGYQVGGRIENVYLFAAVSAIILILSCINFINLTTAGASQRLKEIGVRKSLGAGRYNLMKDFLLESILTSLIAGLVALGLITYLLPMFNSVFDLSLTTDFSHPKRLSLFFCLIIMVGILAGIYPAFLLSGIDSISALKKNSMAGIANPSSIRKALITIQFIVTILLITGAIVVSKQLDYFQNKDLGIDHKNLIWLPHNLSGDKFETVMEEIKKINGVEQIALASMTFQGSNNRGHEVSWPGKKQGNDIFFNFIACSHDLPKTLGLQVVQGRSFSKHFSTDTTAVMINETAARQMNLKDPIGQRITTKYSSGTIIGVLRDFHFESLHNPIGPVILSCRPDWTWNMYIKFNQNNMTSAINELEKVYKKYVPDQIFEFNYQNDQPKWFYRSMEQTSFLIKYFSGFAVFLSCLGLLGLTIFTLERKKKEIGIRKVLGANLSNLLGFIAGQFMVFIFMAIAIAIIPAYIWASHWLSNFAYSIEIKWYYFLLGPILSLSIAMITIGIITLKAAMANPIKSLKTE